VLKRGSHFACDLYAHAYAPAKLFIQAESYLALRDNGDKLMQKKIKECQTFSIGRYRNSRGGFCKKSYRARRGKAGTLKEGVSLRKCRALRTIKKLHRAFPPVNSRNFARFETMFRHLMTDLVQREDRKVIFRDDNNVVMNKEKLYVQLRITDIAY